jgi:hypothetical protein
VKIATEHDHLGRVGGKGDRKGNKVVIRDLERGCGEISRRAASGKEEVKHIAGLVSWRRLGKGEVKRGEEGKERVGGKTNRRQTSGG